MKKIILASNNKHKISEFKEVLEDYEILSLNDIGFYEDIVEDGETFSDNALIKCEAVYEFCMNYSIEGFRKSYANYMKKQESKVSDDLLRALGYSEEDIAKNY